jgi:hypothetical protein
MRYIPQNLNHCSTFFEAFEQAVVRRIPKNYDKISLSLSG